MRPACASGKNLTLLSKAFFAGRSKYDLNSASEASYACALLVRRGDSDPATELYTTSTQPPRRLGCAPCLRVGGNFDPTIEGLFCWASYIRPQLSLPGVARVRPACASGGILTLLPKPFSLGIIHTTFPYCSRRRRRAPRRPLGGLTISSSKPFLVAGYRYDDPVPPRRCGCAPAVRWGDCTKAQIVLA